jgi:hypothetical protein
VSLLQAACCCGGCPTGCECPGDTDIPSTVLVSLSLTDCCGNARTFSVTVSLGGTAGCACLDCSKYSYRPAGGSACPDACTGAITSEWSCGDFGGTNCEEPREAYLRYVNIQTDGCQYQFSAEEDPEGLFSLYGYCRAWVLSTGIQSSSTATAQLVASIGDGCPTGPCAYGVGDNPCTASAICDNLSYNMCKQPTSGIPGTPIGTYTVCTSPLDFCTSPEECPTLDTVTVS